MRRALATLGLLACAPDPALRGPGERPAARAVPDGRADTVLVAPGAQDLERLGAAVVVTDTDGDGLGDVVAGAPGDARGESRSGALWVWEGHADGPVPTAAVRLARPSGLSGDSTGSVLAAAGDVDGDGYGDVLAGVWGADPAGSGSGAAWLLYGAASGLTPASSVLLEPRALRPGDGLGRAVAGGKDLNGDGLSDLLLGAFGADLAGDASGAVWAVYGAEEGPFSDAGDLLAWGDGEDGDWFGLGVESAGDLDGDGYGDALLAAPGRGASGAVWFVPGALEGLDLQDAVALTPASVAPGAQLGRSLGGGEDLDGDGYTDALLGAPFGGEEGAGAVWVVQGGPEPTVGARIDPPEDSAAGGFGAALLLLGDLDGDGLADAAMGAPWASDGQGGVWVVPGDPDAGLDAAAAHAVGAGLRAGDGAGSALAGGDLDGDGRSDLVVGAWGDDRAADQGGVVLVFGGCAGGDADLDGVCASEDCDDADPTAGAPVLRFADEDGDGFGDPARSELRCDGTGPWADNDLDCDDTRSAVHPGAADPAGDGLDGDCDGRERCYQDLDGDGWRTDALIDSADADCLDRFEAGPDARPLDCADGDPSISPGATDVCGDGIDADCDGVGGATEDEDGDGLTWRQEQALGTSDCLEDSDGDGRPDGSDPDPLVASATPSGPSGRGGGCSHRPLSPERLAVLLVAAVVLRRRTCWG